MSVWVVIRTRDDEPILRRTLTAVTQQTVAARILLMNNNSSQKLDDWCRQKVDREVFIADGSYLPGRVLNQAMQLCDGELVVFLNADCPPLDERWLEQLLRPFVDPAVAAVFGRQLPRPDCYPPLARDTEHTFGDGSRQKKWRHCFSMASSALRRSAWELMKFDELLNYSEDIEWTRRLAHLGYRVDYAAASKVEHSHNYSLNQFYWRQHGEGRAEAEIFPWDRWRASLLRYSILPLVKQSYEDAKYCLRLRQPHWVVASLAYRISGALGRRRGFLEGRRAICS